MKTTIQWLEDYLNQKILPCPEGNDYVYGMNVAHENLINYVIPALKEKEKEQIVDAYRIASINNSPNDDIQNIRPEYWQVNAEMWYDKHYNQNNNL